MNLYRLRLAWARWSLAHVEQSVIHMEEGLKLARYEAQRLRVEVELLRGLAHG